MFDLIINRSIIVNHDEMFKGSLAIRNGKIAEISREDILLPARQIIDGQGKMVFPGGIDGHVHFNEPGFEWREDFSHGTRSAAAGGITTIIDMPLQNKPAVTTEQIFLEKDKVLKKSAMVDYAFWGGLVDNNTKNIADLAMVGVAGLKAFLGPVSSDYSTVGYGIVREAMQIAAPLGIVLGFHCEDYSIIKYEEGKALEEKRFQTKDYLKTRPVSAELIAVESIIQLVKETKAKVHICHVSHPKVAEVIKKAQENGVAITAETCPHYLVFTEEDFVEKGVLFKCAPPLRSYEDKEGLWQYLVDGTISCVASDHSPCTLEEKTDNNGDVFKAWGGISGVQTTFQVMFDEIINRRKLDHKLLAKVLAYGPAKAFGLYPQKGVLAIGTDADIVMVNPAKEWEITPQSLFYLNKTSAFVGKKGCGVVDKTILRGQVIFASGNIEKQAGVGRLIKLKYEKNC